MTIGMRAALIASVVVFFGIPQTFASTEAQAAPKQATKRAERSGANFCPSLKASYPKTVNDSLADLSFEKLDALAAHGNTDAMVLVGLKYAGADQSSDDHTAPPVDMDKAMTFFRTAADKKNGYAEYYVGVAYISGLGVPKDEVQAVKWFLRGAQHGAKIAEYWLGKMTAAGRGGLGPDWRAAVPHYRKAAEGGSPDAYVELGNIYAYGQDGLDKDYDKAGFCFRQGARLKSQIAEFNLIGLIRDGHTEWQLGDPGSPPPPKTSTEK